MAKEDIKVGSTSQSTEIFIQDSSSTTGAGLTGLVFNTSGLTAYYMLSRAAAVSITLATLAAVTSAYSSGGFKEIDATNAPGWYRFDIPDAALASGRRVSIHFKGATNMAPLPLAIQLTGWDNQDAVHGGMTALPNAVAGASGGVLISGSNAGTTTFGALTVTGSMTVSDGLLVSRSSANASAITATGNGTGSGIVATSGSGATGDGVQMTAASTNGNGVSHLGTGTGHGFKSTGGSTSGDGVRVTGGGTGHGLEAVSGSGATGAGIQATSSATNGDGINCSGNGTGSGLNGSGGATNGNGILAIAQGTGIGIYAKGGGGASGAGIVAQGTGTNAHGLQTIATGSGDGIHSAGGGSGVDIRGNITGNLVGTVSTLTTYTGNTVQTGDAFARLGAPAGASVSADVAAIKSDTGTILTDVNTGAGAIYSRLGAPAGASMSADIAAVNAKTTNLPASPAAVGSAMTLTTGERTSVADALLDRDMSVGTDSGSPTVRTVRQALRLSRNKWGIAGGTITVTKEDDATPSWTGAVTTTAGNPVSQIDPA